jgi:hypothetical protein
VSASPSFPAEVRSPATATIERAGKLEIPPHRQMNPLFREVLWQQFGAAIDMLENSILACPEEVWSDRSRPPAWTDRDVVGFWYVAFHSLFWLDLYLSGSIDGFAPPTPFTLDELDPAGLLPERPYSRDELLAYLAHCRRKCRAAIETLTEEKARQRSSLPWGELSYAELLLYNLRHVQHHAAQLNLILRQRTGSAPGWVPRSE